MPRDGRIPQPKPTPLRDPPPDAPFLHLVNHDAEQALLGALFLNNQAYFRVGDLRPEHFGYAVHGRIFEATAALIEAGHSANPVTLQSYFGNDIAVAEIGGSTYLARLAMAAVTVTNTPHYAATIVDLYRRRSLIQACQEAIEDAAIVDWERTAEQVLDEHERRLLGVVAGKDSERVVSIGEAARQALASADEAYKRGGGLAGLSTGLADVDRRLGGLLASDLNILAARPSMGKTAMAAQIAIAAAKSGIPVHIFSLEQSAAQLGQRELAAYAEVPTDRQRRGDLEEHHWRRLMEAEQWLSSLPIIIDETSSLSVSQIVQRARRAKRRQKIGLVVIDHLQKIAGRQKSESRRLDIEEATGAFKALAKELDIPVLLLSQLSRAVELRDDKRPNLADLRESGSIEQDADRVLLLFREEYYIARDPPLQKAGESDEKFTARQADWEIRRGKVRGKAEIIIGKDRHGTTGIVNAHWDAGRLTFSDRAW